MENFEIKQEYDSDSQTICSTCLSAGRMVFPLGKYTEIFKKIISINRGNAYKKLQLCWECIAVLEKVQQFQEKVEQCRKILRTNKPHQITTCFSNLAIVHLPAINLEFNVITLIDINQGDGIKTEKCFDITIEGPIENEPHTYKLHENCKKTEEFSENVKTEPKVEQDDMSDTIDNIDNDKPLEDGTTLGHDDMIDAKVKNERIDGKTAKRISNKKFQAMKNLDRPRFKKIVDASVKNLYKAITISRAELEEYRNKKKASSSFVGFKCDSCVVTFNNQSTYKSHKNLHKKRPFVCEICTRTFKSKELLDIHVPLHFKQYACCLCKMTSFNLTVILMHMKRAHGDIFECLKCGAKIYGRRNFYCHHKEYHEKFICDHCGRTCKHKAVMEEHMRKMHATAHICDICQKQFTKLSKMNAHKSLVHEINEFYCVECDKHYKNFQKYQRHLNESNAHRVTPKRKCVPCPACPRTFNKRTNMMYHYSFAHLKQYNFVCDICNKCFLRNSGLQVHKRNVHEKVPQVKDKPCHTCGRLFSNKRILENHIRTHTGERPFVCLECPATFTQKQALQAHLRNVHNTITSGRKKYRNS